MKQINSKNHCQTIRELIVKTACESGESVHLGGSLSMVEIMHVLFNGFLNHRPHEPEWSERDYFILSKGHCVLGYLATLCLAGYFTQEKLATFQQNGSDFIAHPVKKPSLGIESSNGSLGQGLGYGIGLAIADQRQSIKRRVVVLLGDGECNEGAIWEGATLAAEQGLGQLTVIVDVNKLRNDGPNQAYQLGQLAKIWSAFGWHVADIDGHDCQALASALKEAEGVISQPSVIIANTVKGKGVSFMEHNNDWHHNRITPKIYDAILAEFMGAANV